MKKKVLFRAPVLSQSGYGVHARQIAKMLLDIPEYDVKFQLLNWGLTPWLVSKKDHFVEKVMNNSCSPNAGDFDITFQLQLPNEWDHTLGKHNIGITAAVETDKANPQWISKCNVMDGIITPSKHSLSSLTNVKEISLVKPTKVIGESYNDDLLNNEECDVLLDDINTSFNFLIVGQLTGEDSNTDRKNTHNTIKWLLEEFAGNKDVGIILKTNAGRNTHIDKMKVVNMVTKIKNSVNKKDLPKVHIYHGQMSDLEMSKLYKHKSVRCLVSATRGEGFGLPLLEAAICSLPILATNWSSHPEFLTLNGEHKFVRLINTIKQIDKSKIDNNIFVEGARWADVSENEFKKKTRKFYSSPDIPIKWANELSKALIKSHSSANINKQYKEVLKEWKLLS